MITSIPPENLMNATLEYYSLVLKDIDRKHHLNQKIISKSDDINSTQIPNTFAFTYSAAMSGEHVSRAGINVTV